MVRYNQTLIFRHSIVAQYDIYDIASRYTLANKTWKTSMTTLHTLILFRTITNIGGGELLNLCVLSPNGYPVAFVKENNVFVQTITGDEVQLTNDGINGVVYNGVPDWVYEGFVA